MSVDNGRLAVSCRSARKVVGWIMDGRIKTSLAVEALWLIGEENLIMDGFIILTAAANNDGSDYQKLLNIWGMKCSMSGKDNCWDNAVIIYQGRSEPKRDVTRYIEMYYNSNRLHSYLGYKSPNDFKKDFALARAV